MSQRPPTLYERGIAASAQRYRVRTGEGPRYETQNWFTMPGTRSARIHEINTRVDALWRDIYQSHAAPETFRTQFETFYRNWQKFVSELTTASLLLPSTEEWANRQDEQLERYRKEFEGFGGKTTAMPYVQADAAPSNPWRLTALILLTGLAGAAAAIYVTRNVRVVPGVA